MTPTPDAQQRLGRITVAIVVVMLATALVVQVVRTTRMSTASAATLVSQSDGTTLGDLVDPATGEIDGLGDPVYTFVSAPDLLNADIGDIRSLPTWREGMPNSDNKTDEDSLSRLYSEMASWKPDAVFVAGDEVRGHWDQDGAGLQIFGPVDTDAEKLAAIRRAGDFYYPAWKDRFPANGIPFDTVYPALGDHEIGDNPWPEGSAALAGVPTFKEVWADHFTTVDGGPNRFELHPTGTAVDDTAYATYLTPDLLLVSLDTFQWTPDQLRVTVGDAQVEWLRQVLDAAPADTKVLVQGHVPVLTPVRTRGSSALHLEYGGSSALWQVLKEHGVSLYLNGEVHDFTAIQLQDGETVQVSHGGLFAHGSTGYVVGRVYAGGQITLEAREMVDQASGPDLAPRLWQTRNNLQWKVKLPEESQVVGSMVLDDDNHIVSRAGVFAPYEPGVGAVFEDTEDEPVE
jgi:hypothetical protein